MNAMRHFEPSMQEKHIRAALDQHWAASNASDFETEHQIDHDDSVLEYPHSGERTRVDATYRTSAPLSRAKSGLPSGESLAAAIFGSQNSFCPMTVSRPTP